MADRLAHLVRVHSDPTTDSLIALASETPRRCSTSFWPKLGGSGNSKLARRALPGCRPTWSFTSSMASTPSTRQAGPSVSRLWLRLERGGCSRRRSNTRVNPGGSCKLRRRGPSLLGRGATEHWLAPATVHWTCRLIGFLSLQSYHREKPPLVATPPDLALPTEPNALGEIWVKYPTANSPIPLHFSETFRAIVEFRTIMNDIANSSNPSQDSKVIIGLAQAMM